jgi:hypothetical protein
VSHLSDDLTVLVIRNVSDIMPVSKGGKQKFDMQRFNPEKLKERKNRIRLISRTGSG